MQYTVRDHVKLIQSPLHLVHSPVNHSPTLPHPIASDLIHLPVSSQAALAHHLQLANARSSKSSTDSCCLNDKCSHRIMTAWNAWAETSIELSKMFDSIAYGFDTLSQRRRQQQSTTIKNIRNYIRTRPTCSLFNTKIVNWIWNEIVSKLTPTIIKQSTHYCGSL